MFQFERVAASAQLARREVSFKKIHGYYHPNKLQDRHTLVIAGFKKTAGNEAWFNNLIDSEEFGKHFSTHTVFDHDEIC